MNTRWQFEGNGPAFPFPYRDVEGRQFVHAGMSLRDFVAAQAMAALLQGKGRLTLSTYEELLPWMAKTAFDAADAFLAVRGQNLEMEKISHWPDAPRRCRKCGCTEFDACHGAETGSCWWVEPDLCSRCAGLQPDAKGPEAGA